MAKFAYIHTILMAIKLLKDMFHTTCSFWLRAGRFPSLLCITIQAIDRFLLTFLRLLMCDIFFHLFRVCVCVNISLSLSLSLPLFPPSYLLSLYLFLCPPVWIERGDNCRCFWMTTNSNWLIASTSMLGLWWILSLLQYRRNICIV